MDTDPNVLLALLAVRLLGGRSAPATAPAVKGLKDAIAAAKQKGWLAEETVTETTPVEGKKPKTKKVKVVALTDEGERALREAASPEALAATQAQAAAALFGSLRADLDADRAAIKEQVRQALASHDDVKERDKAAKELAKLSQEAAKLAEKIQKLEDKLKPPPAPVPPAHVDAALDALQTKIGRALANFQAAPPPPPSAPPPPAPPPPPPEAPAPPPSIAEVLGRAYDTLRRFREFQEGMVELPRLYHEARRTLPDLTVADFHRELLALEAQRALDLHIRNEEHNAPEPEKGIKRHNKLYYYVYWSRP